MMNVEQLIGRLHKVSIGELVMVVEEKGRTINCPPGRSTQQDYYGWQCGTLLHSNCTGTYTELTVLLL